MGAQRCGAVLAWSLAGPLCAQVPAGDIELATRDATVRLAATATAPHLESLSLRGGFAWVNLAPEPLPDRVTVGITTQPLVWRADPGASHVDHERVELVYVTQSPRLRLTWRWRAAARFGPLEHEVLIENLGPGAVVLPGVPSLDVDWRIDPRAALERLWIEKGADTPSAAGTHRDPLADGDTWEGESSSYARPHPGKPREMIPYVAVGEPSGGQRGIFLGVEFSGPTRITLARAGAHLKAAAGLDPGVGDASIRLGAGARFLMPTVFVGVYRGGPDGAGNQLRRWVRAALASPRTRADPALPLLVANSWGSGTTVDEAFARRTIDAGADLGLEMFHLDAGWYRDIGDWEPDGRKFPNGIAALADYAHQRGLRFGLWVAWGEAGISPAPEALSAVNPATRGWLIVEPPPGWRPEDPYKGITIDIGIPAATAWIDRELERLVSANKLDLLEHDGYLVAQGSVHPLRGGPGHADAPGDAARRAPARTYRTSGYFWADSVEGNAIQVRATRAYYAVQSALRARHPQLLLEVCNDGGRMLDFGSAAHGDYFSLTDTYDPLSNRRAFYDASHLLPPAMLEAYVAGGPQPDLAHFLYVLRSGMMGWFSLLQDTSRWSPEQRAAARAEFALYRTHLRPLIREADLYHVSARPDGVHWDGIEYYDPVHHQGALFAFRGSIGDEPVHHFRLQGLARDRRYALRFRDHSAADRTVSGSELLRDGVELHLPRAESSELVLLRECSPAQRSGCAGSAGQR